MDVNISTEHFAQARLIVRSWREGGYDHVVVVREADHAEHCYPCDQQHLPPEALAGWDYYPIPTLDRLDEDELSEQYASRAELWVADTIARGRTYDVQGRVAR